MYKFLDSVQYVLKTIYSYLRWAYFDLKRYFSLRMKSKAQIRYELEVIEGGLGQSFARAYARDARDRGDYVHYEKWLEEVAWKEGKAEALGWVLGRNKIR